MTSLIPALWSLVLAAEPAAGIAIAKRSGVSEQVAHARAETLRGTLLAEFSRLPIEDFTGCKGRRPCIVDEARKRGWKAVILIETATIVDDALVNVTLVSVDDDGREFVKFSKKGPEADLPNALLDSSAELRAELQKFVKVPVTIVPPAPPTPTVDLVRPPPEVATRPVARWVPLGLGVITAGLGIVFAILSESAASDLRKSTFMSVTAANELAARGQTFQTTGGVLLGVGGALAIGGSLLGLLWPDSAAKPVVAISPTSGTLGVQGIWP